MPPSILGIGIVKNSQHIMIYEVLDLVFFLKGIANYWESTLGKQFNVIWVFREMGIGFLAMLSMRIEFSSI